MVFRVSTEQANSANLSSDRDFAAWFVEEILKPEFPDFHTDLGPRQCIEQTGYGLLYARHFGIERRDLQAQYLFLMWGVGPNFHTHPAFARILAMEEPEAEKIDRLFQVSDADGGAAAAAADDLHWFPWMVDGNVLGMTEDPALADIVEQADG